MLESVMFTKIQANLTGKICIFFVALCATSAQAQLINTDRIIRGLPEIEVVPEILDKLPVEEVTAVDKQVADLNPVLGLGALPLRIEIPSLTGGIALVDVEVENGWRAVEREWLLLADTESLNSSNWSGIDIIEKQTLAGLGLHVLRVRVGKEQDSYKNLRSLFASGVVKHFDRNHVFEVQGNEIVALNNQQKRQQLKPILPGNMRIGMVDTAISSAHPAFNGARLTHARFVDDGIVEAEAHGTAVASLIVGRGVVSGLLPDAELYAASVFYTRQQRSQGATSFSLLKALNWLVTEKVAVINMSLAGPPNTLLQGAIEKVWAKGIPVVAAVGNAGPLAPPLYPAAWDKVIAVTAVDKQKQIYRWAVQGSQVDYSALGVAVRVARIPDSLGIESGTSLASPLVTCLLAQQLGALANFSGPPSERVEEAVKKLQARAQDLGEAGKDKVFGYGFLLTP